MLKDIKQFEFQGKTTFVKAVFEPPFRFVYAMPDEACFYFVKTGKAGVYSAVEKHHFKSDEGVVMQCGNYINEYLENNEGSYCEAIAVHFFPEVLSLIYDHEFPDFLVQMDEIVPAPLEKVEASELLSAYIQGLEFYFDNPKLVSEELIKLKLKELLLLLAKTDNVGIIRSLLSGVFDQQRYSFIEVVEANVYSNLTIEEIAKLSNLSLSSFKREFKKEYNDSPARYIKNRKLEKAAKLLRNTDLRVSEVCYSSGFNDLAHFSRTFQSKFGLSPSKYRT